MQLVNDNDRAMLIIRMQAYAYENVISRFLLKAEREADLVIERFDNMIDHNPTDESGYWAGFYFNQWVETCKAMHNL